MKVPTRPARRSCPEQQFAGMTNSSGGRLCPSQLRVMIPRQPPLTGTVSRPVTQANDSDRDVGPAAARPAIPSPCRRRLSSDGVRARSARARRIRKAEPGRRRCSRAGGAAASPAIGHSSRPSEWPVGQVCAIADAAGGLAGTLLERNKCPLCPLGRTPSGGPGKSEGVKAFVSSQSRQVLGDTEHAQVLLNALELEDARYDFPGSKQRLHAFS